MVAVYNMTKQQVYEIFNKFIYTSVDKNEGNEKNTLAKLFIELYSDYLSDLNKKGYEEFMSGLLDPFEFINNTLNDSKLDFQVPNPINSEKKE